MMHDNNSIVNTLIDLNNRRRVNFYSLGRYALIDVLNVFDIKESSVILLPDFICSDVVEILKCIKMKIVYFSVGKDLVPLLPSSQWPNSDAVIAINYFGIPQPLSPYIEYSKRTGSIIIEDNAHGFLSQTQQGIWLGMRTDAGIFSMRKTLELPDGAAAFINDHVIMKNKLSDQLDFFGRGVYPLLAIKNKIRNIYLIGGISVEIIEYLIRKARMLTKQFRQNRTSTKYSNIQAAQKNPHKKMIRKIKSKDTLDESNRRRSLFFKLSNQSEAYNVFPIYHSLDVGTVPYGFPFRASTENAINFFKKTKTKGMSLNKWPDFPSEVYYQVPDYYKNVWMIHLL